MDTEDQGVKVFLISVSSPGRGQAAARHKRAAPRPTLGALRGPGQGGRRPPGSEGKTCTHRSFICCPQGLLRRRSGTPTPSPGLGASLTEEGLPERPSHLALPSAPRPAPRAQTLAMRPLHHRILALRSRVEQEQEAKAPALSLGPPHHARMTVMAKNVLTPSVAPQAVSRMSQGGPGLGLCPQAGRSSKATAYFTTVGACGKQCIKSLPGHSSLAASGPGRSAFVVITVILQPRYASSKEMASCSCSLVTCTRQDAVVTGTGAGLGGGPG